LIDQATYSVLADQILVDPLEPLLVKGKTLPVAVYNLKGLKQE
jgi:class 3 adenylate cyclase